MNIRVSIALALASLGVAAQAQEVVRVDHFVRVKSTAPSMAGQDALIYLREVATPATLQAGTRPDRVVLFIHGSGTPAEVSFDVPYADYSWMAYIARAGYDAYSMDMTGYGLSTRPYPMNDACNFPKSVQPQFVPSVIAAPCGPSYPTAMSTMSSDWNDIGAVVDHLRNTRGVEKVAMVAWSQGGPRAGGYAARNPDKVSRLVVLAPSYAADGPDDAPNPLPRIDGSMSSQSRADFVANWDRQVGCPQQYEPAAGESVWTEMLASDRVGASWGPGVRRAPQVPTYGFNKSVVSKMTTPFLMVSGAHDKQVDPTRVRQLYADLASKEKVFVDLACSSHNAMWERNHTMLFEATLQWLRDGKVNGVSEGMLRMGY